MASVVETGEQLTHLPPMVVMEDGQIDPGSDRGTDLADLDGAKGDTQEEDALREMWKQCEDPEEKRLLRMRMYKMREDRRLQHFYGKDGQEILDSILKPESNVSGDGHETRSFTSAAVTSSMVVRTTSSEIQLGDEGENQNETVITAVAKKSAIATATIQLNQNQGVTTTNTMTSSASCKKIMNSNSSFSDEVGLKQGEKDQEFVQLKNRILSKDRSIQLKEIEEQRVKQGSGGSNVVVSRRKSSTGENETGIKNVGKVSPKISTTITSNKVSKKLAMNNNVRNVTERESGRVSRRGDGEGVTRVVTTLTSGGKNNVTPISNGRSSSSSTVSTKTQRMALRTTGSSSLTRVDGRKIQGSRTSETTTITRSSSRSTNSSTMTTMKNSTLSSSSTTTITTGGTRTSGFSSISNRKMDGMTSSSSTPGKRSNNKLMSRRIEGSTKSRSNTNESIPLGSVQIEELVEKPSKTTTKLSSPTLVLGTGKTTHKTGHSSSSNTGASDSRRGQKTKPGTKADGEVINRNLKNVGGQVTKSDKTTSGASSDRKTCSKGSTSVSNATVTLNILGSNRTGIGGNTTTTTSTGIGTGTGGQDKGNKVVNKSRESSPKRSGSPSVSSKGNNSFAKGGGGGSKTTLKTGESLQTPAIKVDRDDEGEKSGGVKGGTGGVGSTTTTTKSLFKNDNNKMEESIIRELGILDNYLSQRSISIDEASVEGESGKMNGTGKSNRATTTTMELDHKKVGDGGNVDVMEAGIEPPFTRTEYKYNCPGEENRHHHHRHEDHGCSHTEQNTNETREPQSVRNPGQDTKLNSNIEDQIIVDLDETSLLSTTATRVGKSESRPKTGTTTSPPLKVNLSTNSPNRTPTTTKPNVKKSSPVIEQGQTSNRKVGSNTTLSKKSSLQSSTSTSEERQSKYVADILSRPSVFEGRKSKMVMDTGVSGSKGVSSSISTKEEEEKVLSRKPEPNPRLKKSSHDDTDHDIDQGGRGKGDYDLRANVTPKIGSLKDDNDEDDGDDNPLKPQTMIKHGGGQDHPGAVLKAKSLFETKAQEAALDRTSADFDMDKGITQSAKVSKKAAIFEARSRGERISVSSESSVTNSATEEKVAVVVAQQEMDLPFSKPAPTVSTKDLPNPKKASATTSTSATTLGTSTTSTVTVPGIKREKSSLTATSKQKVESNKQVTTTTTTAAATETTCTRSRSRKSSPENRPSHSYTRRKSSEVKFDMNENLEKATADQAVAKVGTGKRYNQRRESGKSETDDENPSRQKEMQLQKRRKSSSEQGRGEEKNQKKENSTTTTRRRTSEDKKTFSSSPEPVSATARNDTEKRNERRKSSTSSQRKDSVPDSTLTFSTIKKTVVPSSSVGVRSDKLEQDENKRVQQNTTTLTSASVSINSSTLQNSNRMTTSELNAVDGMEDIEELSRLLDKATDYDERSKIRARIRALKRKAALVKKSSASENSETEGEIFTFSPNIGSNSNRDRESVSVNIMNAKNKAVSAIHSTTSTVANGSCNKVPYERRRSSGEIPSNKVTRRKKSGELGGRKDSGAGVIDEVKNNTSNKIEIKKTSSKTSYTATSVTKPVEDVTMNKSSSFVAKMENKTILKSETDTIEGIATTISTKGEEQQRRLSSDTQQLLSTRKYSRDRESPRRGEIEKEVDQIMEVIVRSSDKTSAPEPTPTQTSDYDKKEQPSPSTSPTPEEKRKPFSGARTSPPRDKKSPPRAVSSLIESLSASTTMQKSREMTKAEKYEADILSRPSVFCKRRQEEKEKSSQVEAQVSTTATSMVKTGKLSTSIVSSDNKKVSSRKNSEELRKIKNPSPEPTSPVATSMKISRKSSSDEVQQGSKGNSLTTKGSNIEEVKDTNNQTSTSTTRVTSQRSYSRKGSSKELKVVEGTKTTKANLILSSENNGDSAEGGEKIEMVSKIPTNQTQSQSGKGGGVTKDDQKSEDDKQSSDMEINFNQEQQSQSSFSPPTLKHPNSIKTSQQPQPPSELSSSGQKKPKSSAPTGVKTETTTTGNTVKTSRIGGGISDNLESRRGSTTTTNKTYSKSSTTSSNNSNVPSTTGSLSTQGTESVTSSYGVGPTDDDGAPLFGLRALRKIKQAQEQFATSEKVVGESESVTATAPQDEYNNTKQNLRSNENFGLRALKKKSGPAPEEGESFVPMGSTRESKSEFLSSTRLQQSSSATSTSASVTSSTLLEGEQRTNDTTLNAGSSPKSILKKTSSFTSQIGTSGVVKSKKDEDEDSNNSDEIESGRDTDIKDAILPPNPVTGGKQTMSSEEFTRASSTSTTKSASAHSNLLGLVEDSSWRRHSTTPSPDPIIVSTTTGGGSLSREKVGRSSVKEMSKRFESTETSCGEGESLLNDETQQNLNEDDETTRHKPRSFMRGSSPSRIPSPVKGGSSAINNTTTTTITTTTKSSVEVTGGGRGGSPENIKIDLSRGDANQSGGGGGDQHSEEVSYYSPSDSDGGSSGIIRITRTVTVGGTGRSFLNDTSPIQNISDVIDRMKGEDGKRKYTEDFKEEEETATSHSTEEGAEKKETTSEDGLSLLNKFIGAQIIMQAVEPMLLTKKVTMSSSNLIVNGVNVDMETDSAKLRQLLGQVDGGDRERIENRLRNLESGNPSVERSSSTSFNPRPRPLTKTLSIGGVTLGGGSSDVAGDVTGELMPLIMPLILGQLQSSLDNFGASACGGGGGSVLEGDSHHNISTDNSNNTCTNTAPNALQNAPDTNTNISNSPSSDDGSSSNTSSKCSGGGGPDSGEDCLFDSGTESGDDASPPSIPPSNASNGNNGNDATQVQIQPHHAKSESSPAEFSNFMEGLRNTLKRNQNKDSALLRSLSQFDALGAFASGGGGVTAVSASDSAIAAKTLAHREVGGALESASGHNLCEIGTSGNNKRSSLEKESNRSSGIRPATSSESEADRTLIQQVDKVLSLLRDTLVKDPAVLKGLGCSDLELNPDSEKGKELIALIDRLKSSLSVSTESESGGERRGSLIKEKRKESAPTLPTLISTCEQEEKVPGLEQHSSQGLNSTAAARAQEMLAWAQIRPPDTVPLPWVNHMQPPAAERKSSIPGGDGGSFGEDAVSGVGEDGDTHYGRKGRGGRRRSHARSHTVGVTQEELAEARRYLQETAYRSAQEEKRNQQGKRDEGMDVGGPTPSSGGTETEISRKNSSSTNTTTKLGKDSTAQELRKQHSWTKDVEKGLSNMPRPFVKPGLFDSGYVPPPERRMTCAAIDDSVSTLLGRDKTQEESGGGSQFAKIKPFRTFSLDNAYDPSKSFFTKEETVQIAIHQAAIKKQMSAEEDRRARRNSLSSSHNIYGSGGSGKGVPTNSRDFSLALPKPYSSPQQQNQQHKKMQSSGTTGTTVGGGNGSLNSSFNASPNSNDDHHGGSGNGRGENPNQSGGDSGFTEESGSDSRQLRNDQLVLHETSQMSPISLSRSSSTPRTGFTTAIATANNLSNNSNTNTTSGNGNQRIENVQISLKELNSSSEFPQLQIAITLNTNAGNNGSGNNGGGNGNTVALSNNSITSNNNNIGSGSSNDQSIQQSHFLSGRNAGPNTNLSQNQIQIEEIPSSTSSSKANRYKSKKERKNRLKRANTIDIPQPPGLLLGQDDTSEMEDEEEDSEVDHGSIKSAHFTYAPFKPKTDGDRKFLAFLEKNSAPPDPRPARGSHLGGGANDKFWNNRFFNLKSNFESSSQGSSPSPSPLCLSPNRHAPRSVSEMALTHETMTPSSAGGSDSFSRPVWASRDRGQLPQQVKNKLQVFESKNVEAQSKEIPWRSSAPHIGHQQSQVQPQYQYQHPGSGGANKCFSPLPVQPQAPTPNAKRFVASSSVYSTNNVPLSPPQSGISKPNFGSPSPLQRPVALKGSHPAGPKHDLQMSSQPTPRTTPQPLPQPHHQQQLPSSHPAEGVHMVHATASALEAMKRSGFGPTAVVLPNVVGRDAVQSPHHHHPHSQITSPLPITNRVLGQEKVEEKIELPWAKKGPLSPSEVSSSRDPKAGRILTSKAKFEQMNHPEIIPMHPPMTFGGSGSTATPPPIPPKSANAKAFGAALSQSANAGKTGSSAFSTSVHNVGSNYGQHPPAVGPKPKFGTFGVTQSFDESYKRKGENETTPKSSKFIVPPKSLGQQNMSNQNQTSQSEYQRVPGSAFARKVSSSTPPESQTRRRSSTQKEEVISAGRSTSPTRKSSMDKVDGVQIQTPVVARVMGAAQQQRAAIGGNKMTSVQNEEQVSRMTNARSNIRNILNQFSQQAGAANNDDSSDNNCSPPILKANLQLSSLHNPLTKSLSGNALLSGGQGQGGGYRPTSLVVGQEELSLHSSHSPSLRPYNSPNNSSLPSPLSLHPGTNSSSVSPAPITVTAGIKKLEGTPITSPVHHYQPQPLSQPHGQGHDQERSSKSRASLQTSSHPQNRSLIPKQRSLSEFPKIGTPPKNIGILTIQTNLESLTKPKSQPPGQQGGVPKAKYHQPKTPQVPVQPPVVVNRTTPVQKQSSFPQQQQLLQQMQEQQQSSPKVPKSYPTSDSLQRTSSGSSIFNRAQSLFLSTQEGMSPSRDKNRTKPPSLPKTHGMFPKQFEASMSPDSAKNKQKEVEAYFKQLSQQTQKSSKKFSSSSSSSKTHIRKSASHSKILNRQRSISDGEEDVDQMFESLFKASEEKFSFNRSQISRSAWAQSCSKSLDMSNLMSVVGNVNPHEFPTMQAPSFYNQKQASFFGNNYGQQMQTICESKRLTNFNPNYDLPAPLMKPQLPPQPLVPILPILPMSTSAPPYVGLGTASTSVTSNSVSQIQQSSQISTKQNLTSSTSTSFKSMSSNSTSSTTSAVGGGAGVNKFKQMDQQAKANSGGATPMFKLTGGSNPKDIILYWCQCRTRDYENVKIDNFSSSWSDGLAFCALIHHFYPDAFDYKSLDPKNRRYNFDLAFRVADEKAGIYPLLDTEDMIIMGRRPDWKCVFTYVQSMYRALRDL